MTFLTWWFRIVGLVTIALGVMWLPFLNDARLGVTVPGWDAPGGGAAHRGFLDFMMLFGLELIVLGVVLVVASFRPRRSRALVWLVIALSVVRGILDDIYMIAVGYPVAGMLAFIALHLAIVVTGLIALRLDSRSTAGRGGIEREMATA
jgi:uncharacterized membrane protein HdeD (DUF308 family)